MLQSVFKLYRDAFTGLPREIWLLCCALLVNRAGTMVLPFMSLFLTRDRGFELQTASLLVSAYGLGAIGGAYLGGWLTDRLGSIRAQHISLIASGFGYLALLPVRSVEGLAIALFLVSVAAEAYRPAVMSAAADFSTPDQQARSFAMLRLAVNVGQSLGPALGGMLALYSYSWLFVVDALTCWIAVGVLMLLLPAIKPSRESAPSASPSGGSPWRDLPFLALLVWVFFLALCIFQIFTTFTIYLNEQFGYQEDRIGMLLGFNAVLIVLFEMVLIHKLSKAKRFLLIGVGGWLTCLGLALMPLGNSLPFLLFTVTIWTFGEMVVLPMLNVVIAQRAPRATRGRYMGLFTLAFATAFMCAPLAGAWLYRKLGPDLFWYSVGGLGFVLLLAAYPLSKLFEGPTAPSAGRY